MLKFLIILCLIVKTHMWFWTKDPKYPSPRWPDYWKCQVSHPTYVCDPDRMLTDQQREKIVGLVEEFKEKTKRPNSTFPCSREGLRLIVALARSKIALADDPSTNVCKNGGWTSSDPTSCESKVLGIELNSDAFHYCYSAHLLINIHDEEFERLGNAEKHHINNKNYFDALKNYIENVRVLYLERLAIFEVTNITLSRVHSSLQDIEEKQLKMQQVLEQGNQTLLNSQADIEENKLKLSEMGELLTQGQKIYEKNTVSLQFFNNLYGIISAFFFIIIGLVLLFLIYQIRQLKNDFTKRNAPKIELQLNNMQLKTPIQPVEVVEKKKKKEEVEEKSKALSNL